MPATNRDNLTSMGTLAMAQEQSNSSSNQSNVENFPLMRALLERRSRRFALGMEMAAGPLAYKSRHKSAPLTEAEEAMLVFAACGITGPVLGDLCYTAEGGGNIMAGFVARTIASG